MCPGTIRRFFERAAMWLLALDHEWGDPLEIGEGGEQRCADCGDYRHWLRPAAGGDAAYAVDAYLPGRHPALQEANPSQN